MESAPMRKRKAKSLAREYRHLDPFRGPDWRFEIARQHHQQKTRPREWEDPLIPELVRFLRHLDKGNTDQVSADLLRAHAIYKAGGPVRDEVEARVLAGESLEAISCKTFVPIPVIAAFEPAFFHVRHCLNAIDGILLRVIRLRPDKPVTVGQVWKYLAMAGGPHVLDVMVDHFHNRPTDDPALRADLAAKGWWSVRDAAIGWSSLPAVAASINEGARLFAHLFRGSSPEAKRLKLHLDLTRIMIASAHRANLRKRKLLTGQRNAQKEAHDEIENDSRPVSAPAPAHCAA